MSISSGPIGPPHDHDSGHPPGSATGMSTAPLWIAIDGPAGSGKSTLARALADRFDLTHIETGAMYRALALKALSTGVTLRDLAALEAMLDSTQVALDGEKVMLDGEDVAGQIRSREVSSAASRIAEIPEVRAWCVARQRELARAHPAGAVVEGRDIGTVVLPDAQVKIYLTADLEERASRRALETGADETETLEKVRSRDARDTGRLASPLLTAKDATIIDTTKHGAEQILDRVSRLIESAQKTRRPGRRGPA